MNVTRAPLIVLAAVAALSVAAGARAQAWDVPAFLPPQPGEDIGIYLTTQGDFGIEGIWRQQGNLNLGLRIGYVDFDNDGAIIVGAETWGGLVRAGAEFPLDVTWTAGVGAGFNGGTLFEIPVGLSIGRTFMLSTVPVQVYGHPRLAVAVFSRNDDTETDLEGLFDLGADIRLSDDWKLRLGVTFGGINDDEAGGIGLAYRFGRGVAVR